MSALHPAEAERRRDLRARELRMVEEGVYGFAYNVLANVVGGDEYAEAIARRWIAEIRVAAKLADAREAAEVRA